MMIKMKNIFKRKNLPRLILAVIVMLLPLTVLRTEYEFRVANCALYYIMIAMGLHFITGMVGQVSFAQAAFYGLGAYAYALSTTKLNVAPIVGLLFAIIIPAICALILGVATLKLEGHYMVLGTLGFCVAAQQVLQNWKQVTNGSQGVLSIPAFRLFGFTFDRPIEMYYLLFVLVVLLLIFANNVGNSRLGRSFFAINANRQVADVMGIQVTKVKLTAFIFSGIYAGIAGAMMASYQGYIEANSFSTVESIKHLTMIFIGGLGTLPGAVVGAALLSVLPELLRFLNDWYMVVYALIAILIIIFYPIGLWGFIQQLQAWIKKLFTRGSADQGDMQSKQANR